MGIFDAIIDFFKYIWNSFIVLFFSSDNFIFAIIDILIVTFIVYKIIQFMRQTRAEQLIKGIVIFFAVYFIAQLFHLNALKWLVSAVTVNILVVVVVLFQPELRGILEKLGRSGITSFTITKNTLKNRFGATENAPSLFYTLLKYSQSFKFSSSICTNQAPVFQRTCLYLRRNLATVSMLSVTGRPRGCAASCGSPWG